MPTEYTSPSISASYKQLNGGLNTTSGPLGLQENESPDLQNVDFDKFGSVLKRNGYTALTTSTIAANKEVTGLYWFELADGTREIVIICNSTIYKQDGLDGNSDDITGGLTVSIAHLVDFDTFDDLMLATDNTNVPFKWTGAGNCSLLTVPTNLSRAKFIKNFQNYCFLANVTVTSAFPSRFYWSTIKDPETWDVADYIDVAPNDGQEITGFKVLGDRLVVFKNRSIYNVFFTGDRTIPFVVYKSNSSVGCASHWSIQEVDNGLVFLSYDGLYFYDGNNSYKISDRISSTINGYVSTYFGDAVSMVHRSKSRYYLGITGTGTTHNKVLVWDYFHNAFSLYTGINAASMAMVYVGGVTERPYFGDYDGFVYRMDTGLDDYIENVKTAIDAHYYTNWKSFDDILDKKGVPHAVVYYDTKTATLTFSYYYDLSASATADIAITTTTGNIRRVDMTGRGRVVQYKFANSTESETFRVDGLGIQPHLETNR